MKKTIIFAVLAMFVVALGACKGGKDGKNGKDGESTVTKIDGDKVDTKYYSLVIPKTWEQNANNDDKNFRISKKNTDNTTGTMTIYAYPDRDSEPAKANSGNVNAGATDKGDVTFGKTVYNVAVKEGDRPTTTLYTKLKEKGLLLISVWNLSIDDPEVKAVIENITLK